MRSKKRTSIFTWPFALLMILSLVLSACGGQATPAPAESESESSGGSEVQAPEEPEVREITVLYLDDPPFWKEQADRFTEATGIKVKWEGIPFGSLHDKMLTGLVGGSSPWDVIHVRDDYVAEFASRGLLLDLSDRVTPELKDAFSGQAWTNLAWEGKQYGVPRYYWLWQFYYNQRMFEEAGITEPPKTWSDIFGVADKLTNDEYFGYCEAWGENFAGQTYEIHLRAAGGELFDEEGNPGINTEAGIRGLQWMVDMAQTDDYCPSAFEIVNTGNVSDLFAQGKVAMIASTTQTLRLAENPETSNVVGEVAAALLPGDVLDSATRSETGGLAIPATAKNPDLAWEYIKFVTAFDEQKNMAMAIGSIPANTAALTDPEVQAKYPHYVLVAEQMEYPFGMMKHPKASEVNAAISRHVIAALKLEETAAEAMEKAEQEVLAIINAP